MSQTISIRRPASPGEYRSLQDVQRLAWGLTDDTFVVPVATLVGADRHGGVVLGAFLEDGRAVGMSFAFLARIQGTLGLYSQLTGVTPEFQGQGVGQRLKEAQRNLAKVQQLSVIAWAFDPLQVRNALFNLVHLRATAQEYVTDMYGPRTDPLNAGTRTDRLIAHWDATESNARPQTPIFPGNAPQLITQGHQGPAFTGHVPRGERAILINVPGNIGAIRAAKPELAQAWQNAVREAFQAAFFARYAATAVLQDPTNPGTYHYLLEFHKDDSADRSPLLISGPDNRENLRRA